MNQPFLALLFLSLSAATLGKQVTTGYYKSIFSFGDSLTDTGNLYSVIKSDPNANPNSNAYHLFLPPYGQTYFHHPGRCSDGRLIIDFIAESLGLPLVPAYLQQIKSKPNAAKGVNFAVAGATALDFDFFEDKGIHNGFTNNSLRNQLDSFKELLTTSLCPTYPKCSEVLGNSLILMGEIGGNDYNDPFFAGRSIEEITTFVPLVIKKISTSIIELIELGAVTVMVPGNFPIGCSSAYLTKFHSPLKKDYDTHTGCLKWLNKFAEYHNRKLQKELKRIRTLYPHTNIIYADFYKAAMALYKSPSKFGFSSEGALAACCGGGGRYNFNSSARCGFPSATVCDDPSLYVSWDGLHLTQAAYKFIAASILHKASL